MDLKKHSNGYSLDLKVIRIHWISFPKGWCTSDCKHIPVYFFGPFLRVSMTHSQIQIHQQRSRFKTHRNSSSLVMKWLISGHLWRNYKGNCYRTWKVHSSECRNITKKPSLWSLSTFTFIQSKNWKNWERPGATKRHKNDIFGRYVKFTQNVGSLKKSNLLRALWTLRTFSEDVATLNSRSVIVN